MNERRLSISVQIGYSTAEIGLNTVETALRLYVLVYYTDVVGLSAGSAALAASVALIWDAITDPLMGVISDRTRHRFGGRRGYLPVGGVLLALGVLSVFWPPALTTQGAMFAWMLGSFCFLNTGLTVLSVPFMAMAGELSASPHDRASVFGWRFACANFGAFAAAALPALFLVAGRSTVSAMPAFSCVAAGLVVATAMCSWFATRNVRFEFKPLAPQSLFGAFLAPFQNAAFRPLLAAYVVANIGIGINAATFLYYYQHVLRLPDTDSQLVLAVFLGMFTLSILLWVWLAKRFEKRRPLVVGASVLGIGTTALYVLAPVGGFWWVMICGALGLGAFVGSIVLIDTMLTDVIDHDEVRTRQVRSGLFFGVWRFANKIARAASLLVVGAVLSQAGFVEKSDTQPAAVASVLVVLFGPGVGAFFLGAAAILWRYRFDEEKQQQVRRILQRRRDAMPTAGPGG